MNAASKTQISAETANAWLIEAASRVVHDEGCGQTDHSAACSCGASGVLRNLTTISVFGCDGLEHGDEFRSTNKTGSA